MLNDQSTPMRHRYNVFVEEVTTIRKVYTHTMIARSEESARDRAEYNEQGTVAHVETAEPVVTRTVLKVIKQEI